MVTTRLRVKELLRERRWTTKVLAEKTGLSESYLTHIKNGTRRWNEDALKKLAEAFELSPYQVLEDSLGAPVSADTVDQLPEDLLEQTKALNLQLKIIPVVGQIPAQPSEANNRSAQISTGYRDNFVPVLGQFEDNSMFALSTEDNGMAPNFVKGDILVVCPGMWTNSGDIVAVEYGEDDKQVRAIMQVNYMEDFIVLESVNHKKAPLALVRGKDQFRIIGKVIYRYQKMA